MPRPDPTTDTSRPRLSLDGEWQFQFGESVAGTITVPAPWETAFPELHGKAGTAVYQRTFTVPESFQGQTVLLNFGAVDYFTEVWVNGVPLGSHEGGYTPFAFPIETALSGYGPDAIQSLVVRVTDSTLTEDAKLPNNKILPFAEIPHGKQSWYTSIGGIWQSVYLEARNKTHIERACFLPDIDAGTAQVEIRITGAKNAQDWKARIVVDTPKGAGAIESQVLPLTQGQSENGVLILTTTLTVPNAALWCPDAPNLYNVLVTLEHDGEVEDALHTRFGMRKIESKEGRVWLNNHPYFLIGALDQAFYPKTIYTPPSEDYLRDQFMKAKEMGLNLMRCHIKVPTPSYLELCDEIGLLVWYEIPNGAKLSLPFRDRARQTLTNMWNRDANHPCIVIATIMNESWGIDLNDGEQRVWLRETYHWAKKLCTSWLVVDNSACIPNFHVESDLDDYHIYFNIPDQSEDFAEWVASFASRTAGTYTEYGDAEYRRSEPLLISEFGNWGLPHVDKIFEAEGGEPYWFKTGSSSVLPSKVLERFDAQKLNRAFPDYNALADASQEQEWLSLKWEIEEMRRHAALTGYVITEFTDINWECNGLLDMARNPKTFHHRLKDLQAQDILIPRLTPRTAFWSGETASLAISYSCFSGSCVGMGTLEWQAEGIEELRGAQAVKLSPQLDGEPEFGSYSVGQIWITAPKVLAPTKTTLQIVLKDSAGAEVARTTQNIVFVPAESRADGKGQTVWLYDPLGSAIGLSSHLTGIGYRVVSEPEHGALGLATRWDPTVSAFLRSGGKAVLVATHAKSITISSGLGLRLQERNTNGWWGDWCTSKTWFDPTHFPSLPDRDRFDFEFLNVVPTRVLTGPLAENILCGLFVGWLHNPAALVARLPIGQGNLIVTTFELLPHIGSDPIATLLLHDLFAL